MGEGNWGHLKRRFGSWEWKGRLSQGTVIARRAEAVREAPPGKRAGVSMQVVGVAQGPGAAETRPREPDLNWWVALQDQLFGILGAEERQNNCWESG